MRNYHNSLGAQRTMANEIHNEKCVISHSIFFQLPESLIACTLCQLIARDGEFLNVEMVSLLEGFK